MLIIDRVEGAYAVCEQPDGTMVKISQDLLPENAKEGDCLKLGENNRYLLLKEVTRNRRIALERRFGDLFS